MVKDNAVSASGFEMGRISLDMKRDYNDVFVKKCIFHFANDYGEMEAKFFKAGKDGSKNRLVIEWTEPRDDPFGAIHRKKVEVSQRFSRGAKLEGNKLTVRTDKRWGVEIYSGIQFWNEERRTLDKTGWGLANRDMGMAENMHDDLQDEPGKVVDVVVHITGTAAKAQKIFAPLLLALGGGDLAGDAERDSDKPPSESAPAQTAASSSSSTANCVAVTTSSTSAPPGSTRGELARTEAPLSTSGKNEQVLAHVGVGASGNSTKRAAAKRQRDPDVLVPDSSLNSMDDPMLQCAATTSGIADKVPVEA